MCRCIYKYIYIYVCINGPGPRDVRGLEREASPIDKQLHAKELPISHL